MFVLSGLLRLGYKERTGVGQSLVRCPHEVGSSSLNPGMKSYGSLELCVYEFLTSLGWSLKFFKDHGDEPVLVPGIDRNPPLTELLP